jgi:hypothetical protein
VPHLWGRPGIDRKLREVRETVADGPTQTVSPCPLSIRLGRNPLLSPNKAAALAGISATRLREAIRLGKLKAVMVTRGHHASPQRKGGTRACAHKIEIEMSNGSMSAFPPKADIS